MSEGVAWWPGWGVDHIVQSCPHLTRPPRPWVEGHGLVDPAGTDLCGWCVRVWRAQQAREGVS